MILLSIFTCLAVLATAFAQTGPEIASYFRTHLSKPSDVYLPSDINYAQETIPRWNAFSAPTYIVSVKPATDHDVQKIVRILRSPTG